jgi:hypothetical protein
MGLSVTSDDWSRSVQQPLSMEALASPLSSRAQPRDLRFNGPFVGIFLDKAFSRARLSIHPFGILQQDVIIRHPSDIVGDHPRYPLARYLRLVSRR